MTTVRIPADVDREDRLLAGLTARQLAWLATGVVALALAWSATQSSVPAPVFAAGAVPVASLALLLAFARWDGQSADRLLVAGLRHMRANRRLVPAPEGVPASPAWARLDADPAPLPFPVHSVAEGGVIDLGEDGPALVCRASSLNFGLRTSDEQSSLVAAFARWLNSLDAPVQIVVRAERVDVAASVDKLLDGAGALSHPALEAAAVEHAGFLAELGASRDVLRRVVLIVFRQPRIEGAHELLRRRAEEAARALSGAGIVVAPLSEEEALAALARATEPDSLRRTEGLAAPGETVRGVA